MPTQIARRRPVPRQARSVIGDAAEGVPAAGACTNSRASSGGNSRGANADSFVHFPPPAFEYDGDAAVPRITSAMLFIVGTSSSKQPCAVADDFALGEKMTSPTADGAL